MLIDTLNTFNIGLGYTRDVQLPSVALLPIVYLYFFTPKTSPTKLINIAGVRPAGR